MQTPEGVRKARETLVSKYGGEEGYRNHFREIAMLSQKAWAENGRKPRGFKHSKELARRAGAKGGAVSRRKPAHKMVGDKLYAKDASGFYTVVNMANPGAAKRNVHWTTTVAHKPVTESPWKTITINKEVPVTKHWYAFPSWKNK